MTTVTLSSIEGVVNLLRQAPELLTLPAFSGLSPLIQSWDVSHICCSKDLLVEYKKQLEGSLSALSEDQRQAMKRILKADRIEYYVFQDGALLKKGF